MRFEFNDGGRAIAGFKGKTGDCAVRAIAIALDLPYDKVYKDLTLMLKYFAGTKASKKYGVSSNSTTVRDGVPNEATSEYLSKFGWKWVPTMFFGKGCQVHLTDGELPDDRIIVRVTKHVTAVIDGVLNDTFDCSRDGTRCVYGYWIKK